MKNRHRFFIAVCATIGLGLISEMSGAQENRASDRATRSQTGPEMLMRTDFRDGALPDNKKWGLWQGKTTLKTSNVKGVFQIDMQARNSEPAYMPVLVFREVTLEKGKRYALSYEMRAESPSKVQIAVKRAKSPHPILGLNLTTTVDTKWKIWTHEFTATDTDREPVIIGFSDLEEKHVYQWRRISFRPVLGAPAGPEVKTFVEDSKTPLSGDEPYELLEPRNQYEEKIAGARKTYEDVLERELASLKKRGELSSYLEIDRELAYVRSESGSSTSSYKPDNRVVANAKARFKKESETALLLYKKRLEDLVKELVRTEKINEAKFIQKVIGDLDLPAPETPSQRGGRP